MRCQYSMQIQWSEEDQVYIVTLPEFGGCKTHGATYEKAAKNGQEALESLIDFYQAEGRKLPKPMIHDLPEPVVNSIRKEKRILARPSTRRSMAKQPRRLPIHSSE